MVAVTVDLEMSASLYTRVAATLPMRPCTFETPPCLMLKSTSLWAGSEVQVEYCAMARGAAIARMPVTIAKRFIMEIPFSARPLGRFGDGEETSALTGCAREQGKQCCSR
jgi:hypothetical protein